MSRAMTHAGKGKAETAKTAADGRSVKLLRPAMEALKAQKAHTFLADAEVFQNPRTLERWAGDGPIRKTMGAGDEENWRSVPPAIPNSPLLRLDDAVGW